MFEWLLLSTAVLLTVPLRLALRLDIQQGLTYQIIVYVYGFRMEFEGRAEHFPSLFGRKQKIPFKTLLRFIKRFCKGAYWSVAEVNCTVGTGDACTTALAAGGISGMLRALGAGIGASVYVKPEFNRSYFALTGRCILSFRAGDIMFAAITTLLGQLPMKKKAGNANGTSSH